MDNQSRTIRVFRIKEVIPDPSITFPLREVADLISRTVGPHGEFTAVQLPGRGNEGKLKLRNKVSTNTESVADVQSEEAPVFDDGTEVRSRYSSSTRPPCIPIKVWQKLPTSKKAELRELQKRNEEQEIGRAHV